MKTQSNVKDILKSDWSIKGDVLTVSASRYDSHVKLDFENAALITGVWFNASELPKLIAVLEALK